MFFVVKVSLCSLWLKEGKKIQKKKPHRNDGALWYWATTYSPTKLAVPSARLGLTSLFGMGRGVPQRYNHRNIFTGVFHPL